MSDRYQNILVAIDIYNTYEPVLKKALSLADAPSKISLIYVTRPQIYFEPYGQYLTEDISNTINQEAKKKIALIANEQGITSEQIFTPIGDPSDEIHEVAQAIQADLIVMGTHGQSGVSLLLGSTANSVLHGVKTDVLAVRI